MTTPTEITDVDDIPIPTCLCGAGPMVVDRSDAYRCRKCGREVCRVTTMEYRIEELRTELIATRAKIAEVRRRTAQRCAEIVEQNGKPGPGGIDITSGIPSEIYVAIDRERYDDEGGDYDLAKDTASAVRSDILHAIRAEFALAEQPPQPQAQQQASGTPPARDAGERHGKGKL